MKVVIAAIGRLKEAYWIDALAEYQKRLRPYCQLELVEAKDEAALRPLLPAARRLVLLDERGTQPTSLEFAQAFCTPDPRRTPVPVCFVIGGADGHSPTFRASAEQLIAFGRATMAHRLARIVLIEQIYRGFRIARGEPYHRE